MRLGQGSRKPTPIWTWAIFVGVVALVLPDAAFVGAQEVADLYQPRIGSTGTPKRSPVTEPPATAIEPAQFEVGESLAKLIAADISKAEVRTVASSFLPPSWLRPIFRLDTDGDVDESNDAAIAGVSPVVTSGMPTLEAPSDEKDEVLIAMVTVDGIGAPAQRTKLAGNASVDVSSSTCNQPAQSPSPETVGANLDSGSRDHERYRRVAVLGALTSGGPATALGPPTDAEVMQALECVRRQWDSPRFNKSHHVGVRIVKEKVAEYVDPLRFYPLIGTAQLHHAHYKCTIYFTERADKDGPCKAEDQDAVEVFYIDHNHFHMPSEP